VNILIIGGTRFIGRHIALNLLASGHSVVLMHRSETMALDLPQFEHLIVDRRNFDSLRISTTFDLVIDTCAYMPSDIAILKYIQFKKYLFISSVAVYRSDIPDNSNEDASRISNEDEERLRNDYGYQKKQTEDLLLSKIPNSIILRASIVLGPAENSGRLNRILEKFVRSKVLYAPLSDSNSLVTQFIDVRDLTQLTLRIIESNMTGIFNLVGKSCRWNDFISSFASAGALEVVNCADDTFPLFDSTKSTGLRTLRSRHAFINSHEFLQLEETLIDWFNSTKV
jgi:2'-hydroxyisoflavone reductase